MTRVEFYEKGYAQVGNDLGIITDPMFSRYIHYRCYREQIDAGYSKLAAIQIASEQIGCSESTVWRSVEFFEVS